MNDPLLGLLTFGSVTLVCVMNAYLTKKLSVGFFTLPIFLMVIGLILFMLLVIGFSDLTLWYVSLSLWNGGFFGLFHAMFLRYRNKKS